MIDKNDEKVSYVLRLFVVLIFFAFSFPSFLIYFAAVIDLPLGLLAVLKFI